MRDASATDTTGVVPTVTEMGKVPVTLVTPVPLVTAVIRPWRSTVIFAFVYEPAATPVFAREMVPFVVIGPPVSPVPVPTEVTVPVELAEMVMLPVLPERVTPLPATRLVTPVLVRVTLPVGEETPMPAPAMILVTAPPPPVELRVEVA